VSVKWKRGKEDQYGQYIIRSACERFQIFRFDDWHTESSSVWELRDDCHEVDTFERLRDAKEYADAIVEYEENGGEA